jgi:hypothetical protein
MMNIALPCYQVMQLLIVTLKFSRIQMLCCVIFCMTMLFSAKGLRSFSNVSGSAMKGDHNRNCTGRVRVHIDEILQSSETRGGGDPDQAPSIQRHSER